MEGILKFKLPKDAVEFKVASESMRLYTALLEIDELARRVLKYNADAETTFEEIRRIIANLHLYYYII